MEMQPKQRAAAIVVAACVLSGCGGSASKAHSQVVAQVNDRSVTVLQLNQALQSSGVDTATPEAVKAAIDSLVDEELLVQQAVKDQLDRDPSVVQAIDQARRRVLAQTYAERALYPKAPITLAAEESYYRDHQPLFEHRKLYRLTVFTVQDTDLTDRLSADLDNTHSVDDVRAVLERHEIKFETQQLSPASEDLPLDKLDHFAKADVGDLLIAGRGDGKTSLLSVVSIDERPLSFEHAKPIIEHYLSTVRNKEATTAYLKRVKETAKISVSARYAPAAVKPAATVNTKRSGEGALSQAVAPTLPRS
jgi:EpsD family peptidyl-prolyl cis-trans isomerase